MIGTILVSIEIIYNASANTQEILYGLDLRSSDS